MPVKWVRYTYIYAIVSCLTRTSKSKHFKEINFCYKCQKPTLSTFNILCLKNVPHSRNINVSWSSFHHDWEDKSQDTLEPVSYYDDSVICVNAFDKPNVMGSNSWSYEVTFTKVETGKNNNIVVGWFFIKMLRSGGRNSWTEKTEQIY